MKSLFRILLLGTIFALANGGALAQGFPWEDFKPRTLRDLAAMEKDIEKARDADGKPGAVFHGDMMLTKARVIYTGSNRPISDAKKQLLGQWVQMFTQDKPEYAKLYETDWLFTENGVEYWLPVQRPVAAYFEKELKKGDEIEVFLVRAGGIYLKGKWDWLLFVEEFRNPKLEKADLK